MILTEAMRIFVLSNAKVSAELKKHAGILGIHLTPTIRPLLQKLYVDLHNLLKADGCLPDIKRNED